MSMTEIYIYDGFQLVDVVDVWQSLRWRRQYYGPGEFELHVADTIENIQLYQIGRQINRPDRKETGLIEEINLENGDLEVKGRFLSSWLYDGIIERTYSGNESIADSIRAWVQTYIMPEHKDLILGTTAAGTQVQRFQTSYKNIGENIEKFARASEIGFEIEKDFVLKKYKFTLYRGLDRSAVQSENNRVFFSANYGNVSGLRYRLRTEKYRNYAVVMGQGEGDARRRVIIDQRLPGEHKKVMYINASSVRKEEGMTDAQYDTLLRSYGSIKLNDRDVIENFEGEASEVPDFVYLQDYDIGDIVTIEYEPWGKGMHQRITEVEEVYEGGSVRNIPVFGNPFPEKIDLEDLI